jgi:alpha-mannosidase
VLNESKYGYDALGPRLRLTLIRNAYEPDPASDLGRHEFSYAIVPTLGDWRREQVPEQGIGFNQPLLACVAGEAGDAADAGEARGVGWRPEVEPSAGIVCAQLKIAEMQNGARALRFYDSVGAGGVVTIGALPDGAWVRDASVVEDPGAPVPVSGSRAEIRLRPSQVRTVLIGVSTP